MPICKILLGISRFDSLLRGWQWDIEVNDGPTSVAWRFSNIAGGGWIYDTNGMVGYNSVPIEAGDFICFRGKSPSGTTMSCLAMADPVGPPQRYKIEPHILSGTVTTQQTSGSERTGATGSVSTTGSTKGTANVLFAGAEVSAGVTGTVAAPVDKNTAQNQISKAVETEAVVSLKVTRFVAGFPSIEGRNATSGGTNYG